MGISGLNTYAVTAKSKSGVVVSRLPFGLVVALFRFPTRINQILPFVERQVAIFNK